MDGKQFRAIRRSNKISVDRLALKLNVNESTIRNYEKSDYIPLFYLQGLSSLLRIDLTNKKVAEDLLEKIPDRFFQRNKKNNSFF